MFFLPPPPPRFKTAQFTTLSQTQERHSQACASTLGKPPSLSQPSLLPYRSKSVRFFMPSWPGWNMSHMHSMPVRLPLAVHGIHRHRVAVHYKTRAPGNAPLTFLGVLQPLHKLLHLLQEDTLALGAVGLLVPAQDGVLGQHVRCTKHTGGQYARTQTHNLLTGTPLFKTWGRSEYSFACLATN